MACIVVKATSMACIVVKATSMACIVVKATSMAYIVVKATSMACIVVKATNMVCIAGDHVLAPTRRGGPYEPGNVVRGTDTLRGTNYNGLQGNYTAVEPMSILATAN